MDFIGHFRISFTLYIKVKNLILVNKGSRFNVIMAHRIGLSSRTSTVNDMEKKAVLEDGPTKL